MHSLLDLRVFFLQRLRPSEWQRTLLAAALIGALGALATVAFRESLFLIERLIYGRSDGLVRIAASLPWWERLLVPGDLLGELALETPGNDERADAVPELHACSMTSAMARVSVWKFSVSVAS